MHELLAQVVEEVSIVAAERKRSEPKVVPRPAHARGASTVTESWGVSVNEQPTAPPVPVKSEGPDPSYSAAISMFAESGKGRVKVVTGSE